MKYVKCNGRRVKKCEGEEIILNFLMKDRKFYRN